MENEKLPEWLSKQDNNFVVETKEGKFELQEIEYEKFIAARKRLTRVDRAGNEKVDEAKLQVALISESLVEPKMGELDLMKLKMSTMLRLSKAIEMMYDMQDFL